MNTKVSGENVEAVWLVVFVAVVFAAGWLLIAVGVVSTALLGRGFVPFRSWGRRGHPTDRG